MASEFLIFCIKRPLKYLRTIGYATIFICVAVLVGWQFGIDRLIRIGHEMVGMNPFTALCFIAVASWQLLFLAKGPGKLNILISLFISAFLFSVGSLRIMDVVFGTDVGIDDWLFSDRLQYSFMSPLTASSFLLFSFIIFKYALWRRFRNGLLVFLTPAFLLSTTSLFGYLIGDNDIFTLRPVAPMALHTTICFIAQIIVFLFLFPQNILMQTFLRKYSGGFISRKLLPYIIFVPIGLGFLRYQGEVSGLYETGYGVAIVVVGSIFILLTVLLYQAAKLNTIDRRRIIAEKKLTYFAHELEMRNKELEQLTFVSNHDLQEPLRKIMVFANMIKDEHAVKFDESSKSLFKRMLDAAGQMREALNDILDFISLNKDAKKEKVDLNETIEKVLADLKTDIERKKAKVSVDKLPVVTAVPSQMFALFFHLIDNGLKFNLKNISPEISIVYRESGFFHEIIVSDYGIGFEENESRKIFELFQRLHSKESYKGSGIGLALSKKIVDIHQGKIWASSKPNQGAEFHVLLPANEKLPMQSNPQKSKKKESKIK